MMTVKEKNNGRNDNAKYKLTDISVKTLAAARKKSIAYSINTIFKTLFQHTLMKEEDTEKQVC